MRVLTFGWEFPPAKNGGLGVACFGLTRELSRSDVEVIFVLPRTQPVAGHSRFVFADVNTNVSVYPVDAGIVGYQPAAAAVRYYDRAARAWITSRSLLDEVHRFAQRATMIAQAERFDVIHAHDWTSYLAGLAAKAATGKPLVVHAHATSFDQAGGDTVDPEVFLIEQRAFAEADQVVVLSQHNRRILIEKHGTDPAKISVVSNGCDPEEPPQHPPVLAAHTQAGKKIVLYHGRITIQKGVDYFIRAARRVIDVDQNVVFVVSGSGDMERQIMQQVGALGLGEYVVFAGALWDEERDRMYQSADLLVMPSVSEPFGLVPFESIKHGTPALVSKQSGISEVMTHVLKVDFWDIEEMADKILAALHYDTLNQQLVTEGKRELWRHTWERAAQKIKALYFTMIHLWR